MRKGGAAKKVGDHRHMLEKPPPQMVWMLQMRTRERKESRTTRFSASVTEE